MFLKVTDLAAAIGVDEKTVLSWIKNKGLPAHKQDDRYQVNRVDLLEWATNHGITIPPEIFAASDESPDRPLVSDALLHGRDLLRPAGRYSGNRTARGRFPAQAATRSGSGISAADPSGA